MRLRYFGFVLLLPVCSLEVRALDIDRPEIRSFINQMVETSDYDRKTLNAVLRDAKSQQSILDAISRPAEKTKEWHEYRAIFITRSEERRVGKECRSRWSP